jgi:enoyl-CoA hydratase/carnithine racemase
MPGRIGRFLALTGAAIGAADARFCGIADAVLPDDARAAVLDAIRARQWTGDAPGDRAALSRLLAERTVRDLPAGDARRNFDRIDELMAGDDLGEIAVRLHGVIAQHDDAWLVKAATTFAHGSPTTAALAFELQRRVRQLSLADVFRPEYDVSLGCCAHADLAEGIRALLIDKDKTPRWNPASLAEVTPALVEDHFRSRYQGAHPLAGLDTQRA